MMEFSFYVAALIFDSCSTKVCLRFHRCFFCQKRSFLVEHIYYEDTTKDKNINISSLKLDFKNLRHNFWARKYWSTMQQKLV